MYVYRICVRALGNQKWVLDLRELELYTTVNYLCGCWETNPGPMQGKSGLLTPKLSLQP